MKTIRPVETDLLYDGGLRFKHRKWVSLTAVLQGGDSSVLETQVSLNVSDQTLGAFLVMTDFTGATLGLLDASRGRFAALVLALPA